MNYTHRIIHRRDGRIINRLPGEGLENVAKEVRKLARELKYYPVKDENYIMGRYWVRGEYMIYVEEYTGANDEIPVEAEDD